MSSNLCPLQRFLGGLVRCRHDAGQRLQYRAPVNGRNGPANDTHGRVLSREVEVEVVFGLHLWRGRILEEAFVLIDDHVNFELNVVA